MNTQIPSVAVYHTNFTNFGTDYTLIVGSSYRLAGTDGLDLGTSWFGAGVLPVPWLDADVGIVGVAGSATFDAGTFTIAGAGADVGTTVDAFHYVYQPITNDTQILCHVATVGNTDPFSRVGVMLRASVASDAAHVMLGLRPGGPNQVALVTRATSGDVTTIVNSIPWATVVWFKLTRIASTVTGYISADGLTWTTVGSLASPVAASGLLGMIVLSNDVAQLNTATIDAVAVGIHVPYSDAFEVWVYV